MSNIISSVALCSVPITPTNQIDFNNKQEQFNYFQALKRHDYPVTKYIDRSGTITVSGYVDDLQDCNYGYYTNTYNGTSKTFYFWIVQKELVAKGVTKLTIQLDTFQTWQFDIHFNQCFIERCHVANDAIGANTYPESLEIGDYITADQYKVAELCGDVAYILALTDSDESAIGSVYGKIYSGFKLKFYKGADHAELSNYIQELCLNGKGDAIAFIFTFPQKLLTDIQDYNSGDFIESFPAIKHSFTYTWKHRDFTFGKRSYVPQNNKLYCYPYNFITVKNSSGGNVILKVENFKYLTEQYFELSYTLTQNPTFALAPKDYNGVDVSYSDSIESQGYGLCSWNNDNYANWYASHSNTINAQSTNARVSMNTAASVAQNSYNANLTNTQLTAAQGAMSTLASMITPNILGGIVNGVTGGINTAINYDKSKRSLDTDLNNSNLLNQTNYQNTIRSIMAQVQDAQVQPNTCKGDTTSCGLDLARGTATFFIEQTMIKPEYAHKIDMYFQMFGYQVNTIGTPDFKCREKWNYIKTLDCSISGNLPQADKQDIENQFNNGLRVWHLGAVLFNYTQTNAIKGV